MIRLSVVIPFWNSEQWLRTPIESVLAQDHPAEIIAVDEVRPMAASRSRGAMARESR
jgi:GT2 family glycosyltransferase